MSQGTPINKLGGNALNDDDSRLVDSILSDLNNASPSPTPPTQTPPVQAPTAGSAPQPMSPEQHKAMLAQRQQNMMQQQMMMQQQAMLNNKKNNKQEETSLLDNLQSNWKQIITVVILSLLINTPMAESCFRMGDNTYFLTELGGLNTQAIIIKALIVGISYFIVTTYIPF